MTVPSRAAVTLIEKNITERNGITHRTAYSDDELESVKRQLETIFPKRNWPNTEIALLRRTDAYPGMGNEVGPTVLPLAKSPKHVSSRK